MAPGTSKLPCSRGDSARTRGAARTTSTPIGTLMKKVQRQEASVRTPPRISPMAAPAPEGRGDERQRGGGGERGTDALRDPRNDHLALGLRQSAEQRRKGEQRDTEDEDLAASEQVAD